MNTNDEEIIELDDDWEDDDVEEDEKEEAAQNLEPITIEQVWDVVLEAEKIMLSFVREQIGEEILNKASATNDNLGIGMDSDPKIAELCVAYYSPSNNTVYLTEKYCREKKNDIHLIHTIIHENAHTFSHVLSKSKVNAVVEEAMANLFAEMSIKNYIQKGNRINCLSDKDNDILSKNNGHYEMHSYIKEGEFTRGIMYALKNKNKDMEAFKEYFFGSKDKFVDICEEILGPNIREILTKDLADVQNYLGVEDNTELYLPSSSKKLRNILENYFNYPLDETAIKQHKDGEESALYSVDGNLMHAICFENKLKYEWLRKIDFASLNESNMQEIFSNLTVEDMRELSEKSNGEIIRICNQYGHSDFIKSLIKGWYEVNKENPSNFEEIIPLVGYIPLDVFQEMMKDKETADINETMHFIAQCHIYDNEDGYSTTLEILNQKVGNEFDKEEFSKHKENNENVTFGLGEYMLEPLSKLNLPSESLKKILYIYNNPLTKINSDNILDIVDVLGKIDYSMLAKGDTNKFLSLYANISDKAKETNDIGLLIKIGQLPEEINKKMKFFLFRDLKNTDKYDDVGKAIATLKKYGYEIENEHEILDCITNSEYGNIKIVPNFNAETLLAFTKEKEKTNCLLGACINQFLESDSSMLFGDENFDTCMMLLDDNSQELLGISDVAVKRMCSIMQEKMLIAGEINSEKKNELEEKIKNCLTRLNNKNDKQRLNENDISENDETNKSQELIENGVNATLSSTRAGQIAYQISQIKEQYKEKTEKSKEL